MRAPTATIWREIEAMAMEDALIPTNRSVLPNVPSGRFHAVRLWPLLASLGASGVVALSFHMLAAPLGIPYPSERLPIWADWLNLAGTMATVLVILWLASPTLDRYGAIGRVVTALFVLVLTTSYFRRVIMQGAATDGYAFAFIAGTVSLVRPFLFAIVAGISSRWTRSVGRLAAATLAGSALVIAVEPHVLTPVNSMIDHYAYLQRPLIYSYPYPLWFNIMSYLFFVEEVIGVTLLAALTFDRLPRGTSLRCACLAVIVAMIPGALLKTPLYAATSDVGFLLGLASAGQFAVQFLALGFLVGLAWQRYAAPVSGAGAGSTTSATD